MKPHRIDPISLIFGLLFLGLVGWWALTQTVSLSAAFAGWVVAIALVSLGVVGILASLSGHRSKAMESANDSPEV